MDFELWVSFPDLPRSFLQEDNNPIMCVFGFYLTVVLIVSAVSKEILQCASPHELQN